MKKEGGKTTKRGRHNDSVSQYSTWLSSAAFWFPFSRRKQNHKRTCVPKTYQVQVIDFRQQRVVADDLVNFRVPLRYPSVELCARALDNK